MNKNSPSFGTPIGPKKIQPPLIFSTTNITLNIKRPLPKGAYPIFPMYYT